MARAPIGGATEFGQSFARHGDESGAPRQYVLARIPSDNVGFDRFGVT
jgi:hypothetical protein